MTWNKWLTEKRFTLFRSSIIQEQFIQCILDHTDPGAKILETGIGFATTTELLRDLGYDICGFDIEKTAVVNASERYPLLDSRLYIGDILKPSSYPLTYDVIIHQGVLEHFSDEEIINILNLQSKKCKKIIFDVPNNLRQNIQDEGDNTRFESPQFWEAIIDEAHLKYNRYGRTYDYGDELLPNVLKKYNSDFMKQQGRSSIFVVEGNK